MLLVAGLIQLPEGYGGGPSLGNSYRIHGELLDLRSVVLAGIFIT